MAAAETNSQIWAEISRRAQASREDEIQLGPPRKVGLALLKWSFRDLELKGLHEFPGTVHFVAPNRLRNDTGQNFVDAVYIDVPAKAVYSLPALAPGQEIQLDTITPNPIFDSPQESAAGPAGTLVQLASSGLYELGSRGRTFAGFSDGPALPVELDIPHQQEVHSLIVVFLEQP